MSTYYNEHDTQMAAWLRELIKRGAIADGVVDERSITEIQANELSEFTQCHFFAGCGVWSAALRRAGWSDARPVWTGSCPCQPFSVAGRQAGTVDERHLWPAWYRLIEQCRPAVVLGEQVAAPSVIGRAGHRAKAADGPAWLDVVCDDLEASGYTAGALVFPACGLGAPNIRQRAYWMAHAYCARSQGWHERGDGAGEFATGAGGVADRVGSANGGRCEPGGQTTTGTRHGGADDAAGGADQPGVTGAPEPLWSSVDWLRCTDDLWRPVEPGTCPLVDGPAGVVVPGGDCRSPIDPHQSTEALKMRTAGYGNALNLASASAFVAAAMAVL